MPDYSGEGTGGPSHSGYAEIGPPFKIARGFEKLEADWGEGRVTATLTAEIKKALPHPGITRTGEEVFVPEDAIGSEVWMYLDHPLKNHVVGEDEDSYRWLCTNWSQKRGIPFASFWTSWVLSRAGFSTRDLSVQDDKQLALEIQAALNVGGNWAAPITESRLRNFQQPIPAGEECICVYHQIPYVNWKFTPHRPTWVKYTTLTNEGRERTVREVIFLLRVVAPEVWRGTLLPLKANYTIIHGELDGQDVWDKTHKKATFDSVLVELGLSAMGLNAFFEDIPAERLFEKERGEVVNILDYADIALSRAVEMGHRLHVTIPKGRWINREAVKQATQLNIQRIAGDGFAVHALRTVKEFGDLTPPEEEIPGFGEKAPAKGQMSVGEIVAFLNQMARDMGEQESIASEVGTFYEPHGVAWMKRYIAPLYIAIGLDRYAPLDGWTQEIKEQMTLLLRDKAFTKGCGERANLADDDEAFEGLVAYAKSRLEVQEEAGPEDGAAIF